MIARILTTVIIICLFSLALLPDNQAYAEQIDKDPASMSFAPITESTLKLNRADEIIYLNNSKFNDDAKYYILPLEIDIAKDWSLYANEEGESGSPIQINLDSSQSHNIEELAIEWPTPIVKHDEVNGSTFTSYVYTDKVIIPLKILPTNPEKSLKLGLSIEYGACNQGCIIDSKNLSTEIKNISSITTVDKTLQASKLEKLLEFLLTMCYAALGGLILNFMPCVLPVISIKISQLAKQRSSDICTRKQALLISAGIMSVLLVLALSTIALRSFGHMVGWGYHFQEPGYIMFLIIVMVLMASSMLGGFSLNLPPSIRKILSGVNTKCQYTNSFISGTAATLLATPCTAPFLGTAIAFAISQPWYLVLAIYFCVGFGMSLPYLLLVLAPSFIKFLPKPGRFSGIFQKMLAIPLFATALWLCYVLQEQIGALTANVFMALLIAAPIFYLSRHLRPLTLAIYGLVGVICSIYWLVPQYNGNRHHKTEIWEQFSTHKLNSYIKNNKLVIVNVTAAWCLTCKINEKTVLESKSVMNYINDNNAIMMRANYTNKQSNEIAKYLSKYKRYGIPLNVVYGPNAKNGIPLPELLTKKDLIAAIEKAKTKDAS